MKPAIECASKIYEAIKGMWSDRNQNYGDIVAEIAETLEREFADVLRKAAAMDVLEKIVAECGSGGGPVTSDYFASSKNYIVAINDGESDEVGGDGLPSLPAAIESLAAKIRERR